jgi:hypothetical protein
MCRWAVYAFHVRHDNSEQPFRFQQLKHRLETGYKAEKHAYLHQLKGRKPLVVFTSAISEGLQHGQIWNLTISNSTRDIFECISWRNSSFFSGDDWIIQKRNICYFKRISRQDLPNDTKLAS